MGEPTFEERVQALEEEIASLSSLLVALPDEEWQRPTRLPGWNIFVLVAHLARTIRTLVEYASWPPDAPPPAALPRDPAEAARDVDARARAYAAEHTVATLRPALTTVTDQVIQTARRLGPDAEIVSRGGRARLNGFLSSRVAEACVHGLDLRHALGMPPSATPLAVKVSAHYFERLLQRRGASRPPDLDDDVAFLEAATGRRPHPSPLFPVIQ